MTVAVSLNLSDGVVLGVDSAVSVPTPAGISKVYENAEKLFQLGSRPIGVAIYGLGGMGARGIGSYIREFESTASTIVSGPNTIGTVVEALRAFFVTAYMQTIAPQIASALGRPFDQIPQDQRPGIGLVVGGFSTGSYLSEIWHIQIPANSQPGSAVQLRAQGVFSTNWFAMYGPIQRYVKGYEPGLISEILAYFTTLLGRPITPQETAAIRGIQDKYEYQIPFNAMPIGEGVEHTRFLVQLVVSHHRYTIGAPIVGGKVRLGTVSYRGEPFKILE